MRAPFRPDAAATEYELSKAQVTKIFQTYTQDLKNEERADQQNKKWTYYKSCAATKMRREAGHVFVANAIWKIGLLRLPPFATKQWPVSPTDLEAVPHAIQSVLVWLDRIASVLLTQADPHSTQRSLIRIIVASPA